MNNIIQRLWETHKTKQKKQHEIEEKSAFNITEKDSIIYIMAGCRAIKAIDDNSTAKDIICMLNECRQAQINFTKV